MLGGRFFDNIWDPYSVAYAYPRPQYYRPRADHYEMPEDRSNEQPLNKKTVKTIPVTDGGAPDLKPVAKSEDAAATEIQAFYRGYVVRKTQPLQHLKVIKMVKGELESLKFKSQEAEQKMKLRSDSKERLRWTEGVMALLLRLDSLQGVHPEVRLIRKAVTKELLGFQETIDSMCSVSAESNDVISHETIGNSAAPAPEVAKEMEDNISRGVEQDFAFVGASENGSDGLDVKSNEDLTSENHVPHAPLASDDHVIDSVAPHCDENGLLASETMVEVGVPSASETLPEDPMDAENKEQLLMVSPTHHMEEGELEPASSQSFPPETNKQEAEMDMSQSGVNGDNNPTLLEEEETMGSDGRIIPARIFSHSMALEPQSKQDDKQDVNMNTLSDRALLLQVLGENRKLKDVLGKVLEWGKQQSDAIHSLTHRIAQLEEQQPPSKLLLHGKDRKKRVRPVDNTERSRRRVEKGRRNNCRRHHGYVDSEDWPSVESDDYF